MGQTVKSHTFYLCLVKKSICGPHMATSPESCNEKNKVEERSYIPYRTRDHVHSHITVFPCTHMHTQYIN